MSGAEDGGVSFEDISPVLVEEDTNSVVAKLANGMEGFVLESREHMGLAGG